MFDQVIRGAWQVENQNQSRILVYDSFHGLSFVYGLLLVSLCEPGALTINTKKTVPDCS